MACNNEWHLRDTDPIATKRLGRRIGNMWRKPLLWHGVVYDMYLIMPGCAFKQINIGSRWQRMAIDSHPAIYTIRHWAYRVHILSHYSHPCPCRCYASRPFRYIPVLRYTKV